uniref:Uncharacterized protein n=1 Tax=Candidatus Kentrum sp. FM TaxID=2126340 RepID=A0A450WCY4_9GAMM|nr:MAG: hypothetical protein BECKFM1743A_GA0114220_103552 [Candidatus Kentron sp. FM]VFK14912.1 MAG: hypothetical protein BECKFM1743B_GA0114221_103454 [Candidatus Kentron sp. FM]
MPHTVALCAKIIRPPGVNQSVISRRPRREGEVTPSRWKIVRILFGSAGASPSRKGRVSDLVAAGCAVLLSVVFLYAFHAAISIRYWFAIDIAIDIRYRSSIQPRLFSIAIANRDIDSDSDSERTTITRCGSAALGLLW